VYESTVPRGTDGELVLWVVKRYKQKSTEASSRAGDIPHCQDIECGFPRPAFPFYMDIARVILILKLGKTRHCRRAMVLLLCWTHIAVYLKRFYWLGT